MQVVEVRWKSENEIGSGEYIFRIASMHCVSGEGWRIAEVLETAPAVWAFAVDTADPGDTYAHTKGKVCRRSLHDVADDLVTRNQVLHPGRQFAFNDVEICPAHTTGTDSEENVTRFHFRSRHLLDHKGPYGNVSWRSQNCCFHVV
jgi:hypothetical protein